MTELLSRLPESLRLAVEEQLRALTQNNESLVKDKEALARENKLLRDELRLLRIEKYGPKSEKLNDAQLELLEQEPGVHAAEVEKEAALSEKKKAAAKKIRAPHPGREELPSHLPRRETLIVCPPDQCRCAQCGKPTQVVGYDLSEELDRIPAQYVVNVIKREKRACPRCPEAGVASAPLPAKIVEKGKGSNAVVVDTLISKYLLHAPLYRQGIALQSEHGIELSRATLCGWVMKAGDWCVAIAGAIREDLIRGGYIQADETPIGVQSEKTKGKNHQSYLWEYGRPGGPVVFDFQMGRGRDGPRRFLGCFGGILQCDGYSAYDCIGGKGILFAGCMAHMRRGFVDALKLAPEDPDASAIIEQIGALYAVEKRAREQRYTHERRREARQSESRPVMEKLKKEIIKLRDRALPQSALGKACDYALSQWERLVVYLDYGFVEIDNNLCENSIRPLAVGRKNWLHIGSEEAGPRVAAILSLFETCRRLEINTRAYLLDVLPRVPSWPANRIHELTPMAWKVAKANG